MLGLLQGLGIHHHININQLHNFHQREKYLADTSKLNICSLEPRSVGIVLRYSTFCEISKDLLSMQQVNGSKNLELSCKTLSHKTPHESLKFQEKAMPLQTNDVQAMLLQLERVSEMNFPANFHLDIQSSKIFSLVPTMEAPHGDI